MRKNNRKASPPDLVFRFARAKKIVSPMRKLYNTLKHGEISIGKDGVPSVVIDRISYSAIETLREWMVLVQLIVEDINLESIVRIMDALKQNEIIILEKDLIEFDRSLQLAEKELEKKCDADIVKLLENYDILLELERGKK